MQFYMLDKFKFLLRNGCWPNGFQISLEDSEESFDSAAEDDDEEFLRKILCAHAMPAHFSNLHIRDRSQENLKNMIIKEMPITSEYAEQSQRNAEELMLEEEREKLKLKRRKDRKRRKKERRKAEKEAQKAVDSVDEDNENESKPRNKKKGEKLKKGKTESNEDGGACGEDEAEDYLDVNSAFVTHVRHKLGNNLNNGNPAKSNGNGINNNNRENAVFSPEETTTNGRILTIPERNRELGERLACAGYECASKEQYHQAIELFTRALRNVPNDHRYWGNRSFCYYNIGQYQKALEDAECAIGLAPDIPKGHYRKAAALAGLKDYIRAEAEFQRVLELDSDCYEARQELLNVRLLKVTEMGFPPKRAMKALQQHGSVQAAVEALMSRPDNCDSDSEDEDDIYVSEEEEEEENIYECDDQTNNSLLLDQEEEEFDEQLLVESVDINNGMNGVPKKQAAMDPSNPNRYVSIWVGNIHETVAEKTLSELFSRFGEILSIRMLPTSHCAFINFKDSKAPGPAMAAMQDKELAGKNLVIRYPNKTKAEQQIHQQMLCHQKRLQNAIGCSVSHVPNDIVRARASMRSIEDLPAEARDVDRARTRLAPSETTTQTTIVPGATGTRVKLKGPVNGDECYYWRTTGCAFGDHCWNKHIKENQGVDRKHWHK